MTRIMVETKTTKDDAGLRCSQCEKPLEHQRTWFISTHGNYCSERCGFSGERDLARAVQILETEWKGE
jgi:hypothetical protein